MKRQPLTNVYYACIVNCKTNSFRLPPLTTSIAIKSWITGGIFSQARCEVDDVQVLCLILFSLHAAWSQKNVSKIVHINICGLFLKMAHCFWKTMLMLVFPIIFWCFEHHKRIYIYSGKGYWCRIWETWPFKVSIVLLCGSCYSLIS